MRGRRGKARTDLDLCSGPGKLTEARASPWRKNASRLDRAPFLLLPPEGEPPPVVTSPRVRHHEGGRAPLALLRRGEPLRVPPAPRAR